MAGFPCRVTVSSPDWHDQRDVRATVNIDVAFSMLPGRLLRDLGLTPDRQAPITLPDGRRELMDIGDVRLTVEGSGVTPVVFGPDGPPLLGRALSTSRRTPPLSGLPHPRLDSNHASLLLFLWYTLTAFR